MAIAFIACAFIFTLCGCSGKRKAVKVALQSSAGTASSARKGSSNGGAGLQANAPWPMLGCNAAHTGRGKYAGIKKPRLLWKYASPSRKGLSTPVIGSDGTVYVGPSRDNKLYALDGATGKLKWTYLTDGMADDPAIGPDGTVYVGCDTDKITESPSGVTVITPSNSAELYALDGATGKLKWAYKTGDRIISPPAIGSDGTVYVGSMDGKLYALNGKTGKLRWALLATNYGLDTSPVIGFGDTVYLAFTKFYALNGATGKLLWSHEGDPSWSYDLSPVIGSDGTVYSDSSAGVLRAWNGKTGKLRWERDNVGDGMDSLAISSDDTLYVASYDESDNREFCAFDGVTGKLRWEYGKKGDGDFSGAAIGKNGTIYVGSEDGDLYALTEAKGKRK